MAWTAVNEAYVLGAMPSDLGAEYSGWLTRNPGKASRLSEIAASVVADFRAGLSANPSLAMEPGEDTVPERCLQHVSTIVFYHLAMEMGISINMSAQTAFIRAEAYLRSLYTSEAVIDRDTVGQTPSYNPVTERNERVLRPI